MRGREDARAERRGLLMPHAEAAHAGVDLEMHGDRFAAGAANGVEARDLLGARDGRGQVVVGEAAVLLGQQRAEDQDRPPRAELAQGGCLGDVGDGEQIGPRMHQPRRCVVQAMAVGVGLHHRHVPDVGRERGANQPQVALEGREVDLGPAAVRMDVTEGFVHGARWICGVQVL